MLGTSESSRLLHVMFPAALISMVFSSQIVLALGSSASPLTVTLNDTEETVSTDSPPIKININDFFTPLPNSSYYVYSWDKENIPPKDYQQSYCEKRCRDGKVVKTHDLKCPNILCVDCGCARPACEIYDMCCPDISEPYYVIEAIEVNNSDESFGPLSSADEQYSYPWGNVTNSFDTGEWMNISVFFPTGTTTDRVKDLTWMLPTPQTLLPETNDVNRNISQYSPKLFCDQNRGFLYIRSCPSDFEYQNIVELCKEDLMYSEMTMEHFTRVSDNATQLTYFNQYCAMCNGVTMFVPWQLKINCLHYMKIYMATSMDEVIRRALHWNSDCLINQTNPPGIELFRCDTEFNTNDLIDLCNVTGQWLSYDVDVVKACEGDNLTGDTFIVKTTVDRSFMYYKNIFCAICNMEKYPLSDCSPDMTSYIQPPIPLVAPFSMLLGFREENALAKAEPKPLFIYSLCTDQEWPSPDGGCLPLHCSPGKVLVEGNCSTAIDLIRGLGYKLKMWLTLENGAVSSKGDELSLAGELLENFEEKVRNMLKPVSDNYLVIIGIITNPSITEIATPTPFEFKVSDSSNSYPLETDDGISRAANEKRNDVSVHFWIDGTLMANVNVTRDDVEYTMTELFLNDVIEVQGTENLSMTFRASAVTSEFNGATFCDDKRASNPNITCLTQDFSSTVVSKYIAYGDFNDMYLKVTNVLNCRYASFKSNQYAIEMENAAPSSHVTIRIDLNATILNISDPFEFSMLTLDGNSTLNVCHTLLDEKLSALEKDRHQQSFEVNSSDLAQYILTLVCMGVSMLCLSLTLLTYFLFKFLRNLAGINNIGLSSSLLVAQVSLLASSHTYGPKALCTFLAILTHFLWLCMFIWSFICCFHMFKVFTAKTRRSHSTPRSLTICIVKYMALTFTFPAIVVIAVVVASYLTSGGSRIGYGRGHCYLDSTMLVGLAVVGPLALITLSNLIFFIVTVVKIHNVRKLQQSDSFKKDDQQNLYVYIKLSSMTGAFWAIFILAEGLDVDALRFIAIVLNGLQGVFIFISFICNKRIANLYLRSMGIKSQENQSTTVRSTLGRHQQTELEGTNDKRELQRIEKEEHSQTSGTKAH